MITLRTLPLYQHLWQRSALSAIRNQRDVDRVEREAEMEGAQLLLTTAKDAVKLRSLHFRLPCYVLEVEMELDDESKLLELIHAALLKNKLRLA